MTREEMDVWEDMDDEDRLDAYRDALNNLRKMEGRYNAVRAQLNAIIGERYDKRRRQTIAAEDSMTNDARAVGRDAHRTWERTRADENECDAERRLREEAEHGAEWWNGWMERSDEWRDLIRHAKETP